MFLRYNAFGIVWALLIFFLVLMPGKNMPDTHLWNMLTFDKVAHFAVFAVLVFLLTIGLTKQHTYVWLRFNATRTALMAGVGYGVLLESVQAVVPDRTFEPADLLANVIGALLGTAFFYFVYKFNLPD